MEDLRSNNLDKVFFAHIHSSKQTLRCSLRGLRRQVSLKRGAEAARALSLFLRQKLSSSSLVLSFASFGDEIDLWPFNDYLVHNGKLLLPKIQGSSLKIYHIRNLCTDLSFSRWGVLEPREDRCPPFELKSSFTILVPGLGFDSFHHRLGYGRGYYDRLLSQYHHCPSWGLGFKEQLLPLPIPTFPTDVSLDTLHLF